MSSKTHILNCKPSMLLLPCLLFLTSAKIIFISKAENQVTKAEGNYANCYSLSEELVSK